MFEAGRPLLLALAMVTVPLAGCAGPGPSQAEQLRDAARGASGDLTTPQAALDAGYEPDPFCAPDEGVHWINPDLVDGELDPANPEVLLFLPTTDDVEATSPGAQRFLGVEYRATVEDAHADPPELLGVPLDGPMPGHTPDQPRHAELHVYLGQDVDPSDPFPSRLAGIDCPPSTTPPGVKDEGSSSRAAGEAGEAPASCSETMTGQRIHEHARIELYLDSERPYDLSPERYQLADRRIHFEAGERDAGGATVHLHEAGATMGCLLETLGWTVERDRLITDTGQAYEADEPPFEVFVDGSRSPEGLDTSLRGERTYVLRHNSTASPTPCPDVEGPSVHEHAQLDVYLNGSKPWDFSAPRYQQQAGFVHFEDGVQDAQGARIHVHEARPSLGCLFATLGWETAEHRIETDTGEVYEATGNASIEVLADGDPLEDGFGSPIQQARHYEIRYNATANATDR